MPAAVCKRTEDPKTRHETKCPVGQNRNRRGLEIAQSLQKTHVQGSGPAGVFAKLPLVSLEGPPIRYGMLLALYTATTNTRPPLGPAVFIYPLDEFVHKQGGMRIAWPA